MKQRNTSNRFLIAGLALLISVLACTAPGMSGSQAAPTAAQGGDQAQPSNPPATVTAQPPADPSTICPKAGDGTTLYVSQEDGFCFLYPSTMKGGSTLQQGGQVAGFSGPSLDPKSPEPVSAHFEVAYNGPADVSTSADYAAKWHDAYGAGSSSPVQTTVAGQPAMMIPDVPGMMVQQVAFVVANGQKYTITSISPTMFAELKPQVDKAWSTVTGSIVFFTPTNIPKVVRPDDVCPKPTGITKLLVDLAEGVCMLYPTTFEINAQYAAGRGWFDGGPVLGQSPGGPVRANLTISSPGPADGQTPRQLFQQRLVNKVVSKIDDAGAKDVTINGFPAIVWTEGAPIGSRQAIIVANDTVYTIVNQPYNDPNYPTALSDVELVWKAVTESVAFFSIWR